MLKRINSNWSADEFGISAVWRLLCLEEKLWTERKEYCLKYGSCIYEEGRLASIKETKSAFEAAFGARYKLDDPEA